MITSEFIFSIREADSWICIYLWAFSRVCGALLIMPPTSDLLSVKHKLIFAFLLILPIFDQLSQTMVPIKPFSAEAILILMCEFLTGILLGFIPALYLSLFAMSGNIISMQMGLGMAQINDPVTGTVIPVVSQFYTLCAMIFLFATNGHMVMIITLLESFRTLPFGSYLYIIESLPELMQLTGQLWSIALLVALPSVFLLLVVSIGLGFISRTAPQLNIMSIGFPASLIFGLIILMITIQGFSDACIHYINSMLLALSNFSTPSDLISAKR